MLNHSRVLWQGKNSTTAERSRQRSKWGQERIARIIIGNLGDGVMIRLVLPLAAPKDADAKHAALRW